MPPKRKKIECVKCGCIFDRDPGKDSLKLVKTAKEFKIEFQIEFKIEFQIAGVPADPFEDFNHNLLHQHSFDFCSAIAN